MVGPEDFEEERGGVSDAAKRILTLGLGAYFLTEDTVRRYVKEAKLPRDVARSITQNATKGKDELYGFVARELRGFLDKMDLQEELDRFVQHHKIRISAEIEFVQRPSAGAQGEDDEDDVDEPSEGGKPDVEWNVNLRASTEEPEAEEPEPEPE
jgi:hypothetical protein